MSENINSREDKRAALKQHIEQAQQNLISMAEHDRLSLEQAPREKGYVKVQTLDELRMALEISRDTYFPGITQEWINFEVEHEKQHVEAAKKIYGEDVPHSFGIQFIEDDDGHICLVPMYFIQPNLQMDKDTFKKNSLTITQAPEHHSDGDKKFIESKLTSPRDRHSGE